MSHLLSPTAQNTEYVLFGAPDNASLVVRMALHTLGQAYSYHDLDRSQNQHKAPEYLTHNPQGLIPALLAPGQDQALFETGAILLYLALHHQALLPQNAQQGQGLKWLFFLSNTLQANLRMLFYPKQYTATDTNAQSEYTRLAQARVLSSLQLIEADLIRKQEATKKNAPPMPYWFGVDLSVCDFYLAACVRWAQLYPREHAFSSETLMGQLPRIWSLLRRLEQIPALQEACAQEHISGAFFSAPQLPNLPLERMLGRA